MFQPQFPGDVVLPVGRSSDSSKSKSMLVFEQRLKLIEREERTRLIQSICGAQRDGLAQPLEDESNATLANDQVK